ncbi:RING-H2 finger protein ATL65 [Magnolia sinica]|uniref:RING-H2 finger protein ATL65 n=1 Tax=Magnolia sinica TaxID=86752 RepID=UPI00265AA5FB|nr:RING-H2 finger protein ATL65 [Magnolia sinica]
MTPASPPEYQFEWPAPPSISRQPPSSLTVDFSPPLIAMVVVVGTAFLIVVYFRLISHHLLPPLLRRWRRRRRWRHHPSSPSDVESPTDTSASGVFNTAFQFLTPYGLDETAIKTIPLSVYAKGKRRSISIDSSVNSRDCAVCLLEFEENDCVRTLPACAHAFHVDCIDIWLRSHASCPLCRAGIFRPESPFLPLMSARIRPSLDDVVLRSLLLPNPPESDPPAQTPEIVPLEASPRNETERRTSRRDFLLKRSYSFGFERNLAVDRMVLDTATASPWRYRRGNFWKRPSPSPFTSKARVFSFRGMKSPFFRRRRGFFPLSESGVRFAGGGSSRRSKSLTSPFFGRSSAWSVSSRMRCGDPEALLSPERLK